MEKKFVRLGLIKLNIDYRVSNFSKDYIQIINVQDSIET